MSAQEVVRWTAPFHYNRTERRFESSLGQTTTARAKTTSASLGLKDRNGLRRRGNVWEQTNVAGAFDGAGDHALFHRIGAGALARLDLAVTADHLAQRFGVLIVDVDRPGGAGACDLDLGTVKRLKLFSFYSPFAGGFTSGHRGRL